MSAMRIASSSIGFQRAAIGEPTMGCPLAIITRSFRWEDKYVSMAAVLRFVSNSR
jgi:hypothetical protein